LKKKILHLLSSNAYSGAESVAIKIISTLSDEYEFAYVSPKGPIVEKLKENNITYIPLKGMNPYYVNGILKSWKPDVIHAHDFRASIASAFTSYSCKRISHIHQNPEWIKRINLFTILYSLSSLKYNYVIHVSKAIKDEAVFSKLMRNKEIVLSNYVDITDVYNKSLSSEEEIFDLAFVGRLSEVKDPLKFIQIVRTIANKKPDIKAVMVGDGELKDLCEQKIKDLKLINNIRMLGFLSNPYPVMRNSRLIVITSKWEGFCLVAVEAMALGKPIICTPVGGLNEIVNKECGVFMVSEYDVSEKIVNILRDDHLYNSLSLNALRQSKKFSNRENWIKTLNSLYN
jgi:glycosyltransferase involved in cell wall biosynthesis